MGEAVNAVIAGIAASMGDAVAALAPMGADLTRIFLVIGVVLLGAAHMTSMNSLVAPVLRFTGISMGVLWALEQWQWLVSTSRATANAALAAIGISGFAGMYDLAVASSQRIIVEMMGLSAAAPLASVADSFIAALAAPAVLIGLCTPALLAAVSTVELLIGSALSPLILPFLALGWLQPIGFGAIQWQIAAVLRIIVLGVVSTMIARQVTRIIELPSIDETMQFAAMQQLVVLAVLAVLLATRANRLATMIVAGIPGALDVDPRSAIKALTRRGSAGGGSGGIPVNIASGLSFGGGGGPSRPAGGAAQRPAASGGAFP